MTLAAHPAPRTVQLLALPDEVRLPVDAAHEVLVAELDGVRAVHTWVEDVELALEAAPFDVTVEAVDDGYAVIVSARSLVKDLTLNVDRLDPSASVDAALVTLPAGAGARIVVRTALAGLEEALAERPVLRTANDLVAARP